MRQPITDANIAHHFAHSVACARAAILAGALDPADKPRIRVPAGSAPAGTHDANVENALLNYMLESQSGTEEHLLRFFTQQELDKHMPAARRRFNARMRAFN